MPLATPHTAARRLLADYSSPTRPAPTRVSGGAAKVIATADDVTAAVESLTARLSQSESRAAVAEANCSRQVAELTGNIAALQSQYQYLYAYTRSEPPTQAPTVSPTNVAATCADLPRGSPSGTYDLTGVPGVPRVYCNMEMAGGNWNLCAHAGAPVSGGSRHWYGNFEAADVNFTTSRSEVRRPASIPLSELGRRHLLEMIMSPQPHRHLCISAMDSFGGLSAFGLPFVASTWLRRAVLNLIAHARHIVTML